MPKKPALTLACGDYELIRPMLRGKVEVDGVDLTILTDMDSATRHWRFLNKGEFDIAEVSASSYLAARDNDLPFRAIPGSRRCWPKANSTRCFIPTSSSRSLPRIREWRVSSPPPTREMGRISRDTRVS